MYLGLSLNVTTDSRVFPPLRDLAKYLSMMWSRFLLSLHVLLHTHTLLFSPVTATSTVTATSILPTNATVGVEPTANATSAFSVSASSVTSESVAITQNTTATTSSSSAQPTQTIDPTVLQEILTLQSRRDTSIIAAAGAPDQITAWLSTLGPNGKWPDSEVDYTTGCSARRANWPAQTHWQRILIMSAAWHGGLAGDDQFVKDPSLRAAISSAMGYWFGRDFTNIACLDSGGTSACPCTNPDNSLWNTNWFSNLILIPELVGQVCLLLNDTLVQTEVNNCTHMTARSYATFDRNINGVGFLTGANALDVAKIGIDNALLNFNVSLLTDAYSRVHTELQIKNGIEADGIRADGSFGQHGGMLYNGNYGKDYTNDLLDLEVEAGGTQFAAGPDSQAAFGTLFDGDKWMIFRNTLTGVLHWDFSALGRFISFPVIDQQATGSIKINLTEVLELGQQWSSSSLMNFANSLSGTSPNANAGELLGNRMFYANDYMVSRGRNYVSTFKMFSSRTKNTECTNLQNPDGFHLSDGTLYTYLVGNEYEDIAAAWDWNLIPGITTDYGATPLTCGTTQQMGVESLVGGVSDNSTGIAVMRYTNPLTRSLHFQKAVFFLDDDVQHIMVSNITSTTTAPVYTVLDQKRHAGSIIVNGASIDQSVSQAHVDTLWHANVGYCFPEFEDAASVSVQFGDKSGNWSSIGISTQPPITVDLFAAWIEHSDITAPISYTAFPGTTQDAFKQKSDRLRLHTVQNDGNISAVFDEANQTLMAVFWQPIGGAIKFVPADKCAPVTIIANGNIALIYKLNTGEVTIADPSQSLTRTQISIALGFGRKPQRWGIGLTKTLIFQLPSGGIAGSSVTQTIN